MLTGKRAIRDQINRFQPHFSSPFMSRGSIE
jgi:hypothetical protein